MLLKLTVSDLLSDFLSNLKTVWSKDQNLSLSNNSRRGRALFFILFYSYSNTRGWVKVGGVGFIFCFYKIYNLIPFNNICIVVSLPRETSLKY